MSTTHLDLVLTKEASEILGESVKNVTRRVKAGELKPVTRFSGVRGAFVFNRADVTALKLSLDQIAPARRTSTDAPHAGASVVSEGDAA